MTFYTVIAASEHRMSFILKTEENINQNQRRGAGG
jgi:hypothetical protein